MSSLGFLQKTLLLIIVVLFFSIIGINKKTIDSIDNLNDLEKNINDLRGLIWANYTFVTISVMIQITNLMSRPYRLVNKWTVLFTLIFVLLNTILVVFEELTIRNYKEVDVSKLNNVYIISTIMNIMYFILFFVLTYSINETLKPNYSRFFENKYDRKDENIDYINPNNKFEDPFQPGRESNKINSLQTFNPFDGFEY
jgi:carbon starvation protein CstA